MFRTTIVLVAAMSAITSSPWSQAGDHSKYGTMGAALDALKNAGAETEKTTIYSEIARLPIESSEQIRTIHDEAVGLEKKVTSADQKQYIGETRALCSAFVTAKDPKFADELAAALQTEYESMPKGFTGAHSAKTELDAVRYQMREARLQALSEAVGQPRNRKALATLRKMAEREGATRYFAVGAIGAIGDPADIEDFIKRIERDPKSNFNLNSFGPAAINPILREVENSSVSDEAKGVLISSLEYMATHDNIPKYRLLLKHPNHIVREVAAKGISRVVQPGDEDIVIEVARDSKNMYQLQAYRAMNRIWSERFVPVLRDVLLHDPDPIIRAEAAKMLGAHRVHETVPDLQKAKNDRDGEVRRAADAALKNLQ